MNAASIRRASSRYCILTARPSPPASSSRRSPNAHVDSQPRRPRNDLSSPSPSCAIPALPVNRLGFTHRDYEGVDFHPCAPAAAMTRFPPPSSRPVSNSNIEPHRVAKLSGIGCSSKTPDYLLGQSHGFNSVHGRMPSVLTGANLANKRSALSGRVGRRRFRLDRAWPVRPLRAPRRQHGLYHREQRRVWPDQGPVLRHRRQGLQEQGRRHQMPIRRSIW